MKKERNAKSEGELTSRYESRGPHRVAELGSKEKWESKGMGFTPKAKKKCEGWRSKMFKDLRSK